VLWNGRGVRFEKNKYEISRKIGERVLLPAVRNAGLDVAVVSNGFSCREQIEQGTARRTLHIAELVASEMGLSAATAA
jgi:hypothetical protein